MQGDFAQALMEGVAPQLDGMATSLNAFALNGVLGSAVQNSAAATDDPSVLACLGVRIGRAAGQYEKGVFSSASPAQWVSMHLLLTVYV